MGGLIPLDKKYLVTLALILLLGNVFSEDLIIEAGTVTIPSEQAVKQAQEQILRIDGLSSKIDELNEIQTSNIQQLGSFNEAKFNDLQTGMTIIIILTGLAMLGLHWAIFLYLQSKHLIINQKPQMMNRVATEKVMKHPADAKKPLNPNPDYSAQYEKEEMLGIKSEEKHITKKLGSMIGHE